MPTTEHKRDYYDVLGVDRSATRDQIKQAYRQLALQYHPDRNHAPDATATFRELAEAYAVLSDDTKRRAYDTTGHAGVSERWSADDLMRDFQFGDFFGGRFGDLFGVFGDALGGRARPNRGVGRGMDLRYDLDLTLEEAAKGGDRTIHITRSEKCRDCRGSGAKAGTTPKPCAECAGSGQKQQVQTGKGMRMVTFTTCAKCLGRGILIESPCPLCQGQGFEFTPHSLKVRIPPGMDDGMVVRLAGQGEPHANAGPSGDLLIRTHLRPHPSFQRQGDDLYTAVSLSFAEAALGTKVSVPSLGGEALNVAVPPGTQSGSALRVNGKGMPRLGGKGTGRLFVMIDVRTPTDLTARQRELLKEFATLEAAKRP
ncbi:MAG: J domain-containing protein [Nitrospirota bacterium]|nr:J domain-containing protein [Nitrospirota bacterium]